MRLGDSKSTIRVRTAVFFREGSLADRRPAARVRNFCAAFAGTSFEGL
jgi:hypothetical protein